MGQNLSKILNIWYQPSGSISSFSPQYTCFSSKSVFHYTSRDHFLPPQSDFSCVRNDCLLHFKTPAIPLQPARFSTPEYWQVPGQKPVKGSADGQQDRVFTLHLSAELAHHFGITVSDERLDEFVGQFAVDVKLVPVSLVHVPGTLYLAMPLTQFDPKVGIAQEHKPLSVHQIYHA